MIKEGGFYCRESDRWNSFSDRYDLSRNSNPSPLALSVSLIQLGATADLSAMGFGLRTGRYALIADNLKVTYFAVESQGALEVSSADAVLAKI